MRLFVAIILLSITSISFASEKQIPICSIYYAKKVEAKLLPINIDKYKHCAVSCMLANRCGGFDSYQIGVLKEIWDLFGPGNAELKDIEADLIGIKFSQTKMAVNDNECNNLCKEQDWSQL